MVGSLDISEVALYEAFGISHALKAHRRLVEHDALTQPPVIDISTFTATNKLADRKAVAEERQS